MRKTSMFLKSLPNQLFSGFLLVAIFAILLGGVSQVEAALGTGCGDATGTVATASVTSTSVTDVTKNWKPDGVVPPGRWVGGVVTLTGPTGVGGIAPIVTVTSAAITTSTTTAMSFPTISSPFPIFTGPVTYRVTADSVACKGVAPDTNIYSCLQTGDKGFCKGPCITDVACEVFLVGKTLDAGFGGTKCTSTDALKPGVCLELPGSAQKLPDVAPASTGAGLLTLVDIVTNWVFAIFTVLTLIFILLASFQFVTAGGDAEKIGEARQKLIWAVVGIAIALISKGLVPVIRAIVGG